MKTIVFASTKGGVGKTSLAFATAIEAAKGGSVYLVDLDPQRSLTELCERREPNKRLPMPDNPVLLEGVRNVAGAVDGLTRQGYARDYMIVDTPGSFVDIIKEAVAAADCVVLPVQPSVLDILAQEDVAKIVSDMDRADRALIVLNRIDSKTSANEAATRLATLFPNPIGRIGNRIAYSRALIEGKTGAEIAKADCGPEIAALWAGIAKIIGAKRNEKGLTRERAAERAAR